MRGPRGTRHSKRCVPRERSKVAVCTSRVPCRRVRVPLPRFEVQTRMWSNGPWRAARSGPIVPARSRSARSVHADRRRDRQGSASRAWRGSLRRAGGSAGRTRRRGWSRGCASRATRRRCRSGACSRRPVAGRAPARTARACSRSAVAYSSSADERLRERVAHQQVRRLAVLEVMRATGSAVEADAPRRRGEECAQHPVGGVAVALVAGALRNARERRHARWRVVMPEIQPGAPPLQGK